MNSVTSLPLFDLKFRKPSWKNHERISEKGRMTIFSSPSKVKSSPNPNPHGSFEPHNEEFWSEVEESLLFLQN